jgi:hypothetical protein
MASGRLIDYLGYGLASERPPTPDLYVGAVGIWLSTDALDVDLWDGTQWLNIGTAGARVESVNGQTGAVSIGIGDLIDVLLSSGSEPPDQTLLVYDAALNAWVQLEPGAVGDVLTVTTAGLRYEAGGGGSVSSVNGQMGAVSLSLEDLDDVLPGTGVPNNGDALVWQDDHWEAQAGGGGAVDSVNGQTGAVSLSLEDLDDVLPGTGVPNDGDLLVWQDDHWEAQTPSRQYSVDGLLAADDTWNGRSITGVNAGQAISQWQAVLMGPGGEWLIADAIGSGAGGMHGLAVAAGVDNSPLTVITEGTVRNDAWSWVPGGSLYLGETGALTQLAPSTAGDILQKVGFAISADVIYLNVGDATLIEIA